MPAPRRSPNLVDPSFGLRVASLAHEQAAATRLYGLDTVRGAAVAEAPVTIYDVNGQPLFYDYRLQTGGVVVGTIRTAANRALGSPLVSISHVPPGWDEQTALRLATESLHATTPEAVVTDSRLVCYAYPKIGIELSFRVGRKTGTEIFDAASGGAVAAVAKKEHDFTRYSLLDSLNRTSARVAAFKKAETAVGKIVVPIRPPIALILQRFVHLSPYCPNSPIGLTHYAQITDYFCVCASAQMLMEHYGWNYTQNQIAQAMGTSQAQGGTTGAGLTNGFASLTHDSLPLTFDDGKSRQTQWNDAVTEISANRPLFTQVPHHYRVCVGFSERLGGLLDQMLYIYDPWPWSKDLCSGGAIYWESWATSPVMWFGIVHHA